MAKFPVGSSADIGDTVPADYWQKLGTLLNSGGGSFYNVQNPDFGAVGNGVNDDTAEIQACIDASAIGDTIVFPPGTYMISSPIVLKPFRRYMGWGPAWADQTVIKVANGSSANFQSTSTHSGVLVTESWNTSATTPAGPVHIADLLLHGNRDNNATGQHSGLVLYGEYWSTIENLRTIGNKKHGVLLTRTAKNNVATITGISDLHFRNLHSNNNDGDGIRQLSSGAANNTDIVFSGRTLLYSNGGSACVGDNPGGWTFDSIHFWDNGEHGVYFDSGSHAVKIHNLYGENFGAANVAAAQYFGVRLRILNDAVPPQISNATIQTTDPAGTASFVCYSFVGDGADTHMYTSNVHALGANTSRGRGIVWFANTAATFGVHDANSSVTDFVAGQGKEYTGTGTHAFDPPRVLTGTAAWTPGAIGADAGVTTTVTVTGAALGDPCEPGYNQVLAAGLILSAQVTAANTVTVQIRNVTAGSITPTAGTVRATVWKH